MRLANTPPKGAGRSQGVTKTERLLQIIEGLGQDKQTFLPLGIRTHELAKAADVNPNSIGVLLAPYILNGRIRCCKVTVPGSPAQNEYRKGAGVPQPEFKILNTKRKPGSQIVARQGVSASPPPLSTPRKTLGDIETPTLKAAPPQPEVGKAQKTPAADGEAIPPSADPAVAAAPATPKPPAGAALNKEPATQEASAGDELLLSIDQDGALQIGYGDDPARWIFTQRHTLALGDFLSATQQLWRP